MKKLIAYCGLDCENCDARKATLKNDDALREKTARLWSKMNGEKILPEMINCEGCRAEDLIPRRSTRNFVANALGVVDSSFQLPRFLLGKSLQVSITISRKISLSSISSTKYISLAFS